jgi:hypothetical protein
MRDAGCGMRDNESHPTIGARAGLAAEVVLLML